MKTNIVLNQEKTGQLATQLEVLINSKKDQYLISKEIAKSYLGSTVIDSNTVQFCFWVPGLKEGLLKGKEKDFKLELFNTLDPLNYECLSKDNEIKMDFIKDEIQLRQVDDYLLGIVENVKIGNKENAGSLYWLKYNSKADNKSFIIRDPLVQSCPLGIYAPAEVYDIATMLKERKDIKYFKTYYKKKHPNGSLRAYDIGMILEIHPETATKEGTLQGLTNIYKSIADKLNSNIKKGKKDIYDTLTPAELNFIGFDTIELTPEVPPVEREGIDSCSGEFFNIINENNNTVTVSLKKPAISNWGYDTPIIGTAAINPSILKTNRPHEFIEFVETIHNMPDKPIQLAFDAVLGHCDFQGARLLRTFDKTSQYPEDLKYMNSAYFKGPNMYGRDINFEKPEVRAILLEMFKRKIDLGFDCVRVDGGQDFVKEIEEETQFRIQDDVFINEMVTTTQDINGIKRYLDMNVEDGRPWPNDLNWLYNATYTEHVLERKLSFDDKVKQWGPLIFAHNVHGRFKWFQVKWDRYKDTFKEGENWITGLSNHDNARYFYRMVKPNASSDYQEGDSYDEYYNDQLGDTLPEINKNALDNSALAAISLALLPGSPLFFLNSLFHTPWLFFRDIDKQYGVKVVADEGSRFLTWNIDEETYNQPENFVRLKQLGFKKLNQLISFSNNKKKQAFMNRLFEKNELIKTDPLVVMYLYDNKKENGGYKTLEDLNKKLEILLNPTNKEEKEHSKRLNKRITQDLYETERKLTFTKRLIKKSIVQLRQDKELASKKNVKKFNDPIEKLLYLQSLKEDKHLSLLLEDAAYQEEYNIATWAQDKKLNKLAPDEMKEKGTLTKETLTTFALYFMLDAKDISNVSKYYYSLNKEKVAYNFALRQYRNNNSWLLNNPTNDISLDFFSKKLIANGAKDLGAFFSDKGDVINANTIYYGWRTNPEKTKQIFVIANMEGKPIVHLPLNQFMPINNEWEVVIKSPTLKNIPKVIDKSFILKNFKNGETLVLERTLKN